MVAPYRPEPFGELVIPADWLFYTPLAARLAAAGNEEALQDLINLVVRVRRSRGTRYYAVLGANEAPNLVGTPRSLRGIK